MNSDVEFALRKFVSSRKDLFGVESKFLNFVDGNVFQEAKGFVSTTNFGKIEYLRDGVVEKSQSFAVKHAEDHTQLMEFYAMATITNELFFYTKILPFFERHQSVGHLFPKFYSNLSLTNRDQIESIFIMENLKASGYANFSHGFLLDVDHLSLMMRKAAEFHACSFRAKKADPFGFQSMVSALSDVDPSFFVHNLKQSRTLFGEAVAFLRKNPKFASRLDDVDQFYENLRESLLDSVNHEPGDPTLVLCHGDFLGQNFMFKYENGKPIDVKMIDMGHCKLANPMYDLVRLLMVNVDRETRIKYWDYLIDVYYKALVQFYQDVPSKAMITALTSKYVAGSCYAAAGLVPILEGFQKDIFKANNFEINTPEQLTECWKRVGSKAPQEILQDLLERTSI